MFYLPEILSWTAWLSHLVTVWSIVIFSFVWLYNSLVLQQRALRCLNRSDNTERNKSSWSSITSAGNITLVLHSGSAYAPRGWQVSHAKDLLSIISSSPSIGCYVSWSVVRGMTKSSWSLPTALAKHYLADFTGLACATGVNITPSMKLH